MRIKKGASLQGLDIKMRPVLMAANRIWKKYGKDLVVTSGLDSAHSAGSLHYYGLAVDLRTRYFSHGKKIQVFNDLKIKLGNSYDVINEKTHIHVEWNYISNS